MNDLTDSQSAIRAEAIRLPRATPGDLGISAQGVIDLLDAVQAQGLEMHSFMLARHGRVGVEGWWRPYGPERVHMLHSLTKALTATGVGLAVHEGLFGLDDHVLSFFPDRVRGDVPRNLADMRVRHLLTQTSGHDRGVSGSVWRGVSTSWIDEFLKIPVPHVPGTHFQYSSATSFMLSAIVTRTSGLPLRDYLQPRLFAPLGMSSLHWDAGPEGIQPGGNGASATTEDLLKVGILHAADGVWEGRRILPEGWVGGAGTAAPGRPYGYHWWVLPGRPGLLAFGAFGQYVFVLPEHGVALAMTAAVPGSISRPDVGLPPLIWEYLPHIVLGADTSTAPADALASRMTDLQLALAPFSAGNEHTKVVDFSWYVAEPNEDGVRAVRVAFTDAACRLDVETASGIHSVHAGLEGRCVEGTTSLPGAELHHGYAAPSLVTVAAAGWTAPDTLTVHCQYVETAFRDRFVLAFDGQGLTFTRSVNVNGGPTDRPTVRAWLTR